MDLTPRRWWTGPLDVEHLAWTAVTGAADSARALARSRGQDLEVTTSPELVAASFDAVGHLRIDGEPAAAWAPLSGFVRAADGWVRLHGNYPHHALAITRATGVATRPELEAVLAGWSTADVERAVRGEGGVAVAVRTPDEWAAHPHGAATADDPWTTTEDVGASRPLTGGRLPMEGVRVLDLTRVIAGPTCSQLLACLGADVLRVDPPDRPELLDGHLSNGMGKRSTTLDLTAAPDRLAALLDDADVVLLGYRPGSLDRFGLAPEELLTRRPGLVIASLSAWGEHGPWAHRPGFDSIVQAACGIATTCGSPDRPGALPVQALDHATGHLLADRVMRLLAEQRSGIVRASLLGAARELVRRPAPPAVDPADLAVPTVAVPSPHASLLAVPPPVVVGGATIERPVGGYGMATASWLAAP